jgi:hypothetical protein
LKIADVSNSNEDYPTTRLQKGLLLVYNGQELAEEGIGFGVPILKQGLQTIFPGDLELTTRRTGSIHEVTALFFMNLEERISSPGIGSVENKLLYAIKNYLAMLIRTFPSLRDLLTAISNGLRTGFNWETTYEDAGFCSKVKMIYIIDRKARLVKIGVDTTELLGDSITEVIVMNEQGARFFDRYRDSNGSILHGKEIGCWDEVTAEEASFISDQHQLAFTLGQVKGARLYRGRELIGSRLAWSGFGYSFSPTVERFNCVLRIKRLP